MCGRLGWCMVDCGIAMVGGMVDEYMFDLRWRPPCRMGAATPALPWTSAGIRLIYCPGPCEGGVRLGHAA